MLIGFFLPWTTVSCAGMSVVTFTGYQLASGIQMNTGGGIQQVGGAPDLWWLVVAAIAALVITVAVTPRQAAAVLSSFAGVAGFIDILAVYRGFHEQSSQVLSVTTDVGFWLSLLGLLLIVVGGAIGLG
jgi:hypothetical protein